jgi:chemotaxis signal transduction protein
VAGGYREFKLGDEVIALVYRHFGALRPPQVVAGTRAHAIEPHEAAGAPGPEFATFFCAGNLMGLRAGCVAEAVSFAEVSRTALGAHNARIGILGLSAAQSPRGRASFIWVHDLGQLHGQRSRITPTSQVMVLRRGEQALGLLVDELHAVTRFAEHEIEPSPLALGSEAMLTTEVIKANQGRLLIQVLDAPRLFAWLFDGSSRPVLRQERPNTGPSGPKKRNRAPNRGGRLIQSGAIRIARPDRERLGRPAQALGEAPWRRRATRRRLTMRSHSSAAAQAASAAQRRRCQRRAGLGQHHRHAALAVMPPPGEGHVGALVAQRGVAQADLARDDAPMRPAGQHGRQRLGVGDRPGHAQHAHLAHAHAQRRVMLDALQHLLQHRAHQGVARRGGEKPLDVLAADAARQFGVHGGAPITDQKLVIGPQQRVQRALQPTLLIEVHAPIT